MRRHISEEGVTFDDPNLQREKWPQCQIMLTSYKVVLEHLRLIGEEMIHMQKGKMCMQEAKSRYQVKS